MGLIKKDLLEKRCEVWVWRDDRASQMKAPGLPCVPSSPGGPVVMSLGSHAGGTTSTPGHRVNILHTM